MIGPLLAFVAGAIAVMVFHLTGAERFLIGEVITGDNSNRDRDAEFKVHGMELTALFRSFSVMERASRRVVFISAVVGSVNSDSKSLSLRVMANSSLP